MTQPPHARDPRAVLKDIFGYEAFRGLQEEAIAHVIAGGHALILMPTGGGKSLCYQIPAMCRSGTGVVVSPLIALMQDQVEALRQRGVHAAAWNSASSEDEIDRIMEAIESGGLDSLDNIIGAIRDSGALELTRAKALGYADAARSGLGVLPPSPARDALETLARYAVDRTY